MHGKRKKTCEKTTVFPEEQTLSARIPTYKNPSTSTRAQYSSNSTLYKLVYTRIHRDMRLAGVFDF